MNNCNGFHLLDSSINQIKTSDVLKTCSNSLFSKNTATELKKEENFLANQIQPHLVENGKRAKCE